MVKLSALQVIHQGGCGLIGGEGEAGSKMGHDGTEEVWPDQQLVVMLTVAHGPEMHTWGYMLNWQQGEVASIPDVVCQLTASHKHLACITNNHTEWLVVV